jgi:GNAT superfamily N-acetyltransferase
MLAEVIGQSELGLLDLSGLWVAARRGKIVGAMLTQALAGRAAAVWPPEVRPARGIDPRSIGPALVAAALADYRRLGFLLAQSLIGPDSPPEGASHLEAGGLKRVTELVYLRRSTSPPLDLPAATPSLAWGPYREDDRDEFGRLLAETYRGSLDMPEMAGLRSLDDILAGHRAGGRFDPSRWRLGRLPAEPGAAALVLLSADFDHPSPAWEIAYLGLTPPARGRGLGLAALAHALELARPHAARLELAVDVRNLPADRLYAAAGFLPFHRRAVHIATLN